MSTHAKISYAKSAIRIAGYLLLLVDLTLGVVTLVVSEGIGIFEEIGH